MEHLGIESGPPRITCDGCGRRIEVVAHRHQGPPRWFLELKAPPGWLKEWPDGEGGPSLDWCPSCKGELGKGQVFGADVAQPGD